MKDEKIKLRAVIAMVSKEIWKKKGIREPKGILRKVRKITYGKKFYKEKKPFEKVVMYGVYMSDIYKVKWWL